jgi:hypothetical protein
MTALMMLANLEMCWLRESFSDFLKSRRMPSRRNSSSRVWEAYSSRRAVQISAAVLQERIRALCSYGVD